MPATILPVMVATYATIEHTRLTLLMPILKPRDFILILLFFVTAYSKQHGVYLVALFFIC